MKITIRGVDDYIDLVSALAAVTNSALRQGFFDEDKVEFTRADGEPVPTAEELAEMVGLDSDPGPERAERDCETQMGLPFLDGAWQIPGPVRYVPCPARGQHGPAECWMCWGDALLDASARSRLGGVVA